MIDITKLPSYVEERRLPLIQKTLLGSKSSQIFNLQTAVKSQAALNLLKTDVVLGDGSACGWNEAGKSELSQRILKAGNFKVNMSFCDKELLKTWAGYEVKVAAGMKTLPFEEEFVDGVIKGVKRQIESIIWVGKDGSSNIYDALADGAVETAVAASDGFIKLVNTAYETIPSDVLGKTDLVVFVSPAVFRGYQMELAAKNLYHYDASAENGELYIPATNVKVIAVAGMADVDAKNGGNPVAVAGSLSNFFYGCDLVNDEEVFDMFYSKDNREFRLAIEFNAGAQIAYPSEVSVVKAN